MNFLDIIASNDTRYNFHSHTQFCDGRDIMENFVTSAIAKGFHHYGFTPHSPVPIASSRNMKFEAVDSYIKEFNRLKGCYGDRINLYLSLEIDYLSPEFCASNSYFSSLPLDYRLSSVHFIKSQDGDFVDIDGKFDNFKRNMSMYFHDDIEYVVNQFYNQSVSMVEAGGFDIIGHFDKIGHNASHYRPGIEDESWYNKRVVELFEAIMDHHLIVEVNTKALALHNRLFPNVRYFDMLRKYNAPVLVNSDAHYPDLIDAGRDFAIKLLKK